MELQTQVMVSHPGHPLNGSVGRVVGRRGRNGDGDMWILIYIASRMRSYLIPESMLSVRKEEKGIP